MEASKSFALGKWRIKTLIKVYLSLAALILSWFFPPTNKLWVWIDQGVALSCNHLLEHSPTWQHIWAALNSKNAHWIYDVFMVGLLLPYITKNTSAKEGLYRFAEIAFITIWAALTFYLFNRVITWKILHIMRASPSVVYPNFFHLSDIIQWTKVKVATHQSFPSDHGSTFCFFTIFLYFFRGKKWGTLGLLFSIPFAIPRIVVGAHWVTDYLLGSLPLVLFHSGWLMACPWVKSKRTSLKLLNKEGL